MQSERSHVKADDGERIERITIGGWGDPVSGKISRNDIARHLLTKGWRREGDWFVNAAQGRVPATEPLKVLVIRVASILGCTPKDVFDAIARARSP
jgi:hypothetical protein